jgi:hypothetical protein
MIKKKRLIQCLNTAIFNWDLMKFKYFIRNECID